LGVVEAELLRRLNASLADVPWPRYEALVKHRFAQGRLAEAAQSPRITVPAGRHAAAAEIAEEMIRGLRSLGVRVEGDLEDLRPHVDDGGQQVEVQDADLLALTSRLVVESVLDPAQTPATRSPRPWLRRVRRLRSRMTSPRDRVH
jgi:hypothetical protein